MGQTGRMDAAGSPTTDIWAEQARIGRELAAWSIGSIVLGGATALATSGPGGRALAMLDRRAPGAAAERAREALERWAAGTPAAGAVDLLGRARVPRIPSVGDEAVRAFGAQNAVWGAIDLAVAVGGRVRRKRHLAQLDDPADPAIQAEQRSSLRRALLVSAGMDVAFLAGGAAGLAWSLRQRGPGQPLPAAAGHAAGVLVQAGFLLALDTRHAARLRER